MSYEIHLIFHYIKNMNTKIYYVPIKVGKGDRSQMACPHPTLLGPHSTHVGTCPDCSIPCAYQSRARGLKRTMKNNATVFAPIYLHGTPLQTITVK